jgi:D-alanyl-D-alanine carboxypeptidase (penicillin-binding protein 5/6)
MPSFPLLVIAALFISALSAPAKAVLPPPPPPRLEARAWILVDANSGRVITSRNADEAVEPASLTKLMTAYAVFSALSEGRVELDTETVISERAWRAGGSRMFIDVGSRVSIDKLLQGMIVQSGNDASLALAEAVAGSEETFASLMNQHAQALGMRGSRFFNSAGLPDEGHLVTARDMATLARAIIGRFPEEYRRYSQREFTWNGITQPNRNGLLDRDPSVDGMKTGYTEAAGYCLVSSAQRDGMRLIAVVMGTQGPKQREDASLALLNYGFNFFETVRLHQAGTALGKARVFGAEDGEAAFGPASDVFFTIPRGRSAEVVAAIELRPGLQAPLAADAPVGKLRLTLDGKLVALRDLYPLAAVPEGGIFRRAWDGMAAWLD